MKHALFALIFLGLMTETEAKDTTTIVQAHGYKVIHADELKSWYDQGKEMIVIDSRSKPYFDGIVLPNAKWLSYDVSESELKNILPSKDSTIVVYCSSTACPASKYMADRLVKSGYLNVYKFAEGLKDWMQKKYPTEKR